MKKAALIVYLVFYLLFSPLMSDFCLAQTSTQKRIVFVQTFDEAPSHELDELRGKIEKYLSTASDITIIPAPDVVAYFGDQKKSFLTKGDRLYYQAEDLYYSFTPEKSYGLIKAAIDELKKHPGVNGNLVKAYLLKAQVEWYLNHPGDAHESLLSAISNNLGQEELSDFYYDPKMRHFYSKAYKEFLQNHEIITLNIHTHRSKKSPIYVNGILRGQSPQISIKVPADQIQWVSTGNDPEAPLVAVSNQKKITITVGQNVFNEGKIQLVGFKNDTTSNLVQKSFGLGSFSGADYVILLGKENFENGQRVSISAVNVRKYRMTDTKIIETHDLGKSYKSVASVAGDFIMSLDSKNSLVQEQAEAATTPVAPKKSKSFFKKPVGKIVLGALLVGTVAAVAVGVAGSSGGASISSASISGPVPSVPAN